MALVKQHGWKFGFVETNGKILIYYIDLLYHRRYAGNFLNNFYKNAKGGVKGALFWIVKSSSFCDNGPGTCQLLILIVE